MTTAALLQATSVVANTIVAAEFHIEGHPGGVFDATPTNTIVSVFGMDGVGGALFVTNSQAIAAAALASQGAGAFAPQSITIVTGPLAGVLTVVGIASVQFRSAGVLPLPDELTLIHFITGPEAGVIPVEIVTAPGPDVLDVRVVQQERENYTPVVVDPTNPMRKKIRIVNG